MTKDDRLRDELMGLTHDTDCPDCHIRAESRTCEDCGRTLTITDCGHYQQPRPIAASQYQGHGYACAACEQARATAVRDDAIDDDR